MPPTNEPKIVKVPIMDLQPNRYNPNQQTVEQFDLLVKSMKTTGFTLPVLVNSGEAHPEMKNMIADGEHRWRAGIVLGIPEVPVVYADLDEAGMKTATLRHNLARGHHDALMEANVIKSLAKQMDQAEVGEALNIDPVELDILLKKADDFTSMSDVASVLEDEMLETLNEQGLEGDAAKTVAHHHAIIERDKALSSQDAATRSGEVGQDIRVEFVYAGKQAQTMRGIVSHYGNAHDAILELVRRIDGA